MGVTNGFLILGRDELHQLQSDEAAFPRRGQARDESSGHLDMDKAGYELLFMLDPLITDPTSVGKSPYQNIADVLGGGQKLFPGLELGCGPAQIIDGSALRNPVGEFDKLDFDTMLSLATDEIAGELLMAEMNEEKFGQYHWDTSSLSVNSSGKLLLMIWPWSGIEAERRQDHLVNRSDRYRVCKWKVLGSDPVTTAVVRIK